MARISGARGAVYVAATEGGQASPVAFMASWTLDRSSDRFEVTAFGDTNKTYVAGLADASGSMTGFYDDATNQTYDAATDGLARKTYFYANTSDTTKYYFGTAFWDFSATVPVDGGASVSATFNAATSFQRVG